MRHLVLIEFTADTATRSKGQRLRCDAMSATSLCDRKKVAKRVDQGAPPAAADPGPVAVEPVEDTPPPADDGDQ